MWWSERMGPRTIAALAASGVTVFLLAGCGFQLRGEPATGLKTLHVPGAGVAQEIRRKLARGPTRVTPTAAEAEAWLKVLGEAREKTVHTITGAGRVYEFQLTLV